MDVPADVRSLLESLIDLQVPRGTVEVARRALGDAPDDIGSWVELAVHLRENGANEAALLTYDTAIRRFPGDALPWNNRGFVLLAMGQASGALAHFERAIELRPGYASALEHRANALERLRRFDEAADGYREALRVRPDSPTSWNSLGACLRQLGGHEEAKACFEKAAALDSALGDPLYNLMMTARDEGHLADAASYARRLLAIDPGDIDAQRVVAESDELVHRVGEHGSDDAGNRPNEDEILAENRHAALRKMRLGDADRKALGMMNDDTGALPARPLKGSSLRKALAARLQERSPDPGAVTAWNADRRRRRLSTRDHWTDPPDLFRPRVMLCTLGAAEGLHVVVEALSGEFTRRGYRNVASDEECDLVVALVTDGSRRALEAWNAGLLVPCRLALDRAASGVPLLVLWHGGDAPPFAVDDMVDIRRKDIRTALEDSVPELSIMLAGVRGDNTVKTRLVGWRDFRQHLEKLDETGQFVNIQTQVGLRTYDDDNPGDERAAIAGNLEQIKGEIEAEAEESRKRLSLGPDERVPLESSAYVEPAWPGMHDQLRRIRELNEGQATDTWRSPRLRERLSARQGERPELVVTRAPRLFVGYRWEDPGHESWVEQMVGELYGRGYDVMFDRHPERLDDPSDAADLLYRIAECTHFVAIVTEGYLQALRTESVGDAPWARREATWARREWDKARSLAAKGSIGLVAAWRSGTAPPAEINRRLVADLRTDDTVREELDRLFPPVLVTVVAELADGRRVESTPPIPRSLVAQVVDDMEQKFHPRDITAYAEPGPLTSSDHE